MTPPFLPDWSKKRNASCYAVELLENWTGHSFPTGEDTESVVAAQQEAC
jgi:hypothetical protein